MALPFTRTLAAGVVVYDCMDELSLFKGAPPALRGLERELLERADLVFTGGVSLYQAKKHQHRSVHAFPSSVDKTHFAQARGEMPPPPDQATIPGLVRLVREGTVMHEGRIASLRRFNEDAREVVAGFECGVLIEDYNDVKEGDHIEAYELREVARTAQASPAPEAESSPAPATAE